MVIGAGGGRRFMRVPRLVAVAVGVCGLTAAAAAAPGWGFGGRAPRGCGSCRVFGSCVLAPPWPTWPSSRACSMPAARRPVRRPLLAVRKPTRSRATSRPKSSRLISLPAVYASGVTGKGTTIVIVDSFGSPTIRNDLSVFDQTFGLPAPPSFKVIQPAGNGARLRPEQLRHGRLGRRDHAGRGVRARDRARAPASCWSRPRCRRPRACTASRRSSRPRSTCSGTTSAT